MTENYGYIRVSTREQNDPSTNAYTRLPQENAFIDVNGYVHFTTNIGNDIIISVGALERR